MMHIHLGKSLSYYSSLRLIFHLRKKRRTRSSHFHLASLETKMCDIQSWRKTLPTQQIIIKYKIKVKTYAIARYSLLFNLANQLLNLQSPSPSLVKTKTIVNWLHLRSPNQYGKVFEITSNDVNECDWSKKSIRKQRVSVVFKIWVKINKLQIMILKCLSALAHIPRGTWNYLFVFF